MKTLVLLVVVEFVFLSTALGQAKILTNDPLTGQPLLPVTESVKKNGNEPVKMPDGQVCKSKMHGDFYKLYDYFAKDNIKLSDAVSWYASHLLGFKKIEFSDHSQTIFYKPDGMVLVIVDSQHSSTDGVVYASSAAYETYQSGLSEKTIEGMAQKQKIVCQ